MTRGVLKPWSMQWELTWGCNRRCWFCGIHDTPVDTYQHMTLELARAAATELGTWQPRMRIEFGTGGEPTLNPQFFDIVRSIRELAPMTQVMVQTNCEPWVGRAAEWIREFFGAGGNVLVLNCYKVGLKEKFLELLPRTGIPWVDFYDDNPDHLSMYHNRGPKKQQIFLCDDLGRATLQGKAQGQPQRWLNNQGGSTPLSAYRRAGITPQELPMQKRCTRVFREMVLSWDGRVPLCCYDWLDRLVTGRFPEMTLDHIWSGRPFQLARKLLYDGHRAVSPCDTCDYNGGFRPGIHVWKPNIPGKRADIEAELATYHSTPPSIDLGYIPLSMRPAREQAEHDASG